jgi:hypothetical protein
MSARYRWHTVRVTIAWERELRALEFVAATVRYLFPWDIRDITSSKQ